MKKRFLILLTLSIIAVIYSKSIANSDEQNKQVNSENAAQKITPLVIDKSKPYYKAEVDELILQSDQQKYINKEIRFFNKGGDILKIDSVISSCSCGSAKITLGNVHSVGFGKLNVSINVTKLAGLPSSLDIIIYSNATNSPVTMPITIK